MSIFSPHFCDTVQVIDVGYIASVKLGWSADQRPILWVLHRDTKPLDSYLSMATQNMQLYTDVAPLRSPHSAPRQI
jgi:hypothetical protein